MPKRNLSMSLDLTLNVDVNTFNFAKTVHQHHMRMIEASVVDELFFGANPLSERYKGNKGTVLSGIDLRECVFLNTPAAAGRQGYIAFYSPVGCQAPVTEETPMTSQINAEDLDALLYGDRMASTDVSGLNLDILPPDPISTGSMGSTWYEEDD